MPELPDFDTDDAISAELDGELDAYAIELGVDPDSLRAQMTARPEYSERGAVLAAARDALGAPVAPLDEVSRARLLGAAIRGGTSSDSLRPGRSPGRSRGDAWNARLAAAAAILVVVLGAGVLLITRGGDDSNAKSASSSTARTGDLGNIGAIDQGKLERLIGGTKAAPAPAVSEPAKNSAGATGAERSVASAASGSSAVDQNVEGFDPTSPSKASAEQVQACESGYQHLGTIRFSGTGAYQGQAAVVLGITQGRRTVVFVLAATNCDQVLFSISR